MLAQLFQQGREEFGKARNAVQPPGGINGWPIAGGPFGLDCLKAAEACVESRIHARAIFVSRAGRLRKVHRGAPQFILKATSSVADAQRLPP
jgi:hypothetical protein